MAENDTRGILTDVDKEWLRGETDYTHRQTDSDRRRAIRDRVSLGMQDFNYLVEYLSREDREKIAARVDQEDAEAMVAFLYLLLNEKAEDPDSVFDEELDPIEEILRFRTALSDGIRSAKRRMGSDPGLVTVDANVPLQEFPSVDDIKSTIDTHPHWASANEYTQGAFNVDTDDPIDRDEAALTYQNSLRAETERELFHRRQKAEKDIRRHDREPYSTGLL